MQTRSPRTILAMSAALVLAAAAIVPTAAFARGPGAADCEGDCTNEQPVAQQVRAGAGRGQNEQARPGKGGGKDSFGYRNQS